MTLVLKLRIAKEKTSLQELILKTQKATWNTQHVERWSRMCLPQSENSFALKCSSWCSQAAHHHYLRSPTLTNSWCCDFFSSWPGHSFILYAMCNYSIMFQSPLTQSIHLVSSLMSFKALFAAKPPLDTGCMSCSLDRDASSEPRDIFHVHMMFHTLHEGQSVFRIQDGKASSTSLDQHPTALLSLQLSKAQDQATS